MEEGHFVCSIYYYSKLVFLVQVPALIQAQSVSVGIFALLCLGPLDALHYLCTLHSQHV